MKTRPPLIRRSSSSVANEEAHVAVYAGNAGYSFDAVAQLLAPITDPVDSAANAYDEVRLRVWAGAERLPSPARDSPRAPPSPDDRFTSRVLH